MIIACIPLLYFTCLFFYQLNRQKALNAGSIIVLFYIFSSAFSIVYLRIFKNVQYHTAGFNNMVPTVLYCFLLTLVILPIYDYRTDLIIKVDFNPKKELMLDIISWVLIILSIISMISSYDLIVSVLRGDIGRLRLNFYRSNTEYTSGGSQSLLEYILSFGSSLSPVSLLLFFYGLIYRRNKKLQNILLLFASLTSAVLDIAVASRTQFIYWIMTAIVLYFTFRPQMSLKIRRISRIIAIIFGALALTYVMAITVSRFRNGSASLGGVQTSLIAYIGMPYPEFCQLFNVYKFDSICWDRTFPIITKYLFRHSFSLPEYRTMVSARIGMDIGTFYTFLGDAMVDFGKVGMIIYAFAFYCIERITLRRGKINSVPLHKMIVFLLIFRLPLLGLFAYVYLKVGTSLLIIGAILIIVLLNSRYTIVLKASRKNR